MKVLFLEETVWLALVAAVAGKRCNFKALGFGVARAWGENLNVFRALT